MFAEILEPFGQHLERSRQSRGPQEVEIHRAGTGAGIIITSIWWAATLGSVSDTQRQAAAMLHGSVPVPPMVWTVVAGWTLFLLVGALLLFAGASRARGGRDPIVAAKALAWIAVAAALLWRGAFVPDSPVVDMGLLTIYLWTIASGTTRVFLALRGMPVQRLPDPEDMPDLPVSGPASREQAAEGMSDGSDWSPPRFRS